MRWRERVGEVLLFLLPLSLIGGSHKLSPLPIYIPEVVALAYVIWVASRRGVRIFWSGWQELPERLRFSLKLLFLGVLIGVIFAPNLAEGLGAAKSWFIVPALFTWAFWVEQPDPLPLYASLICFALFQTAVGFHYFHHPDQRLQGTFASPNYYAAAVVPIILITAQQALQRRWLWLVVLILLIGLLLSQSLGGFMGLGVALLVWLLCDSHRLLRRSIPFVILVILLAGLVIGRSRFANLRDSSFESRLQIWNTGLYLGKLYPLSGTGLRSFPLAYHNAVQDLYQTPIEWVVPEPHDLYLAFWLDTGVLGLLGFLGLVGMLVWSKRMTPGRLALLAILGLGLVDTPFFKIELAFLFWIYIGLILREYHHAASS